MKTQAKRLLLDTLSRATGRHALLLPGEARSDERILRANAPYRVEGSVLEIEVLEPEPGKLTVELLDYEGHFPTRQLWIGNDLPYPGPCRLVLDFATGALRLADASRDFPASSSRRFACRLTLTGTGGLRARLTGHYRAVAAGGGVDRAYFEGGNYVDHEAQSAGEAQMILHWLRRFGAAGPVLEVGCATGGVLAALEEAGLPSFGLDFSEWAVERAHERLGPDRAWTCDVEADPFPPEAEARAPFGTLVLWSVFEHFREPFATLEKLGRLLAPGATLLLQATNAQSLTRSLFGGDWEGYFDWTHLGVDAVSVATLREGLPRLGWTIEHLHTHLLWTASADPSHATLRDWYAADARFRRLLAERDLGDLVLVVARKAPAP